MEYIQVECDISNVVRKYYIGIVADNGSVHLQFALF